MPGFQFFSPLLKARRIPLIALVEFYLDVDDDVLLYVLLPFEYPDYGSESQILYVYYHQLFRLEKVLPPVYEEALTCDVRVFDYIF